MSDHSAVTLERMTPSHMQQTYLWLQDAHLRHQIDSWSPPSEQENEEYWKRCWNNPSRMDYAILDARGQHVGNCGLSSIDRNRKKCELWLYLGHHHGKGLGSCAVRKLIHIAFDELGMERVYLRILASNTRAIQFYEKIGFTYEGRWREDTILGGERIDSLWYSILRKEWNINNG